MEDCDYEDHDDDDDHDNHDNHDDQDDHDDQDEAKWNHERAHNDVQLNNQSWVALWQLSNQPKIDLAGNPKT